MHFTFWPKEGGVAWFVAVRPPVVLQERKTKLTQQACKNLEKHNDADGRAAM